MLESYYKLQMKLKQFSSLQMHFSRFGLHCRRKPLTTFIRLQSTELAGLGEMLQSYYMLQMKLKTVPKFTDALQLIWSALPEKAIDNVVKDNRN